MPVALVAVEAVERALAAAEQDGYDLVVIDTPPHASVRSQHLIAHADLVVIPVQPSAPPSAEEAGAVLSVSPPHLERALMILWHAGLRPGGELLGLNWSDVDFRAGVGNRSAQSDP